MRVLRGARYRFLIYVIVLLMISNVASFVNQLASYYWCASGFRSNFWNVVKWLAISILYGFYNNAHWILASKYNQIASAMPFLLQEEIFRLLKLLTSDECTGFLLYL